MIISHKYKFIFIKTGKVGGSSLEIALSRFLGPDDVITPLRWDEEKERYIRGYRTAQNFAKGLSSVKVSETGRWVRSVVGPGVLRGEGALWARKRAPKRYREHMEAQEIREQIGDEKWADYYKFCVERNPWDKVISGYFWDPNKRKCQMSFGDFVRSGRGLKSNFRYYSINGIVSVDRLIRYDRLYEELKDVARHLGLPQEVGETLRGLSAKGGYRKDRDVDSFYDDETRKIVEVFFAREIRLLGFEFGRREWAAEEA